MNQLVLRGLILTPSLEKKDKEWFDANRKSNETYAVKVYFKKDGNYGVATNEEYELIKKFLTTIYTS